MAWEAYWKAKWDNGNSLAYAKEEVVKPRSENDCGADRADVGRSQKRLAVLVLMQSFHPQHILGIVAELQSFFK